LVYQQGNIPGFSDRKSLAGELLKESTSMKIKM